MQEQVDKGGPLFRGEVAFIDYTSHHEDSREGVGEELPSHSLGNDLPGGQFLGVYFSFESPPPLI